jgi:hypothetical protein
VKARATAILTGIVVAALLREIFSFSDLWSFVVGVGAYFLVRYGFYFATARREHRQAIQAASDPEWRA